MVTLPFDRDTLLDLSVNAVPLFIILFFAVGFAVVAPWGLAVDDLGTIVQFGLLVVPFVCLAVLTYVSGKAIGGAEAEASDETPGAAGPPPTDADDE